MVPTGISLAPPFVRGEEVLPGYHARTRAKIASKLRSAGVIIHTHHRAAIPDGFLCHRLGTAGHVRWTTGQPDFECDVSLWAIGSGKPNSAFLPASMLDEGGYVVVDEYLQVKGHEGSIFAVGDIAATDPARTSARNNGWALVGSNMVACLDGAPEKMRRYMPPSYRWGSILGPWDGGAYQLHFQSGVVVSVPLRVWNALWPLVQRYIFAGMRNTVDWTERVANGS